MAASITPASALICLTRENEKSVSDDVGSCCVFDRYITAATHAHHHRHTHYNHPTNI